MLAVILLGGCQDAPVEPRSVETGRLSEAEAGSLVRAAGRITRKEDDAPYGYKVFIDDGSGEARVFLDVSTGLVEAARTWRVGDSLDVVGVAGRYGETPELAPRRPADIR